MSAVTKPAPIPASVTPVALRAKAPTFSRAREAASPAAGSVATAVLARPAAPARMNPYVGAALAPSEIQTLMQHAGSGCPMGPCKGCPHFEIPTGACTA